MVTLTFVRAGNWHSETVPTDTMTGLCNVFTANGWTIARAAFNV